MQSTACDACGSREEAGLLACAGCDKVFHARCLKGPPPVVLELCPPPGDFFGPCCSDEPGGMFIPEQSNSDEAEEEAGDDAEAGDADDGSDDVCHTVEAFADASDVEETPSHADQPHKASDEAEGGDDGTVCAMCGDSGNADVLVLCDGCSGCGVHTYCMVPPLSAVPKGDWFCERCSSSKGTGARAAPLKRPVAARQRTAQPTGTAPRGSAAALAAPAPPAVSAAADATAKAAPQLPSRTQAAVSGVGAILASACWKQPVAATVYSGLCSSVSALPAGGIVWRGSLSWTGAAASGAAAHALSSLPHAPCIVVARPPATGSPGAGSEGISRAVAGGRLLPDMLALTWAASAELPSAWEPLALLRLGAASASEEQTLAALEDALDAQADAGTFTCALPHATFYLRSAGTLPAALRPAVRPSTGSLARPPACLYGLIYELPAPELAPLPPRSAVPARPILRHAPTCVAPQPLAAPAVPPPGEALRSLRFTLLGFAAGDPAASAAVDAALREGAHYESMPTPHNVDLVVLEPSLVHRLPEFALRLADFTAVRRIRFVAGARHVELCAAARRVLDPRFETRAEIFPDGAIVVTDANTLATCDGAVRDVMQLLCRCAAATNAAAAAAANVPLGERLARPPAWPWRLALNPMEWAALQRLAKEHTATASMSSCAADAVASIEEAMSGPGPGVGTTGVPRAVLFTPEEVSRSTVADPPQAVRDAVKASAAQAGTCRHVFLMSSDPAMLDSARAQRSISCGSPAVVCDFLEDWLAQIRAAHSAAVAAVSVGAPVRRGAHATALPGKGVRFSAVLDDGGTRHNYRGYSPPPARDDERTDSVGEPTAAPAEARPSPLKVARKREREGAALSGAWPLGEAPEPADDAADGLVLSPPPGFPTKRPHADPRAELAPKPVSL